MKTSYLLAFGIAIGIYSQINIAGSITDTYATGDTLTAVKMDSIKTAVNGNATDIAGNTADIAGNTADIASASRFYGDGSAGPLTVSASEDWQFGVVPTNLNFTDITIDPGFTLSVPAGTTIRCSGTFTNNGSISVYNLNNGGRYNLSTSAYTYPQNSIQLPGRGDTPGLVALSGQGHSALGVFLSSGSGDSTPIRQAVAASSFKTFKYGGSGGAGAQSNTGGHGGGLLNVYCKGDIINNGTISANGSQGGGGGGGGGIVVLASSTSVDNTGVIEANGGNGENQAFNNGNGGGGGGGIIILVAPAVSNAGTASVLGGTGGNDTTALTQLTHSAGGGGGASGGTGGDGGFVDSSNVPAVGSDGSVGYVLELLADPAYMQ